MYRFAFFFVAALVFVLAACGDDDDGGDVVECGGGSATCAPVTAPCGTDTPPPQLATAPAITFGTSSQALRVEVADTAEEQHLGLMNRDCLGDDWGMLFIFRQDVTDTFFMRDTLVPLSIAWIKADGTILEIEDMQPQTEDQHSAPAPYRCAIEAKRGWFAEHGIEAGDRATIPENLSAS